MKQESDFVYELPKAEQQVLSEYDSLSPQIMFKIIRKEGEAELQRSFTALVFSALGCSVFI